MFYRLTLPPCEFMSFLLNRHTHVHLEMTPLCFCLLAPKIVSWNFSESFISHTLLYFILCSLAWLREKKLNVRNKNYLASDFAYDDPTNDSVIIDFQEGWLIYLKIDLIWSAIGNYILFKELSLEACSHIDIMHLLQ